MNDSLSIDEQSQLETLLAARATLKIIFLPLYSLCFIIGTIGNSIVIVMTCNVLSSMHKSGFQRRRSISSTNHVFIYVLGLSIVDLLVILHLPLLVIDMLKGGWLFGSVLCKLYWFGESVNKLLSSFLMTVLSWDRYMAVCSPVKSMRMRSPAMALFVLILCSIVGVVLLLPVLIKSDVVYYDVVHKTVLDWIPEEIDAETVQAKCAYEPDFVFIIYTFLFGFAIPAVFITGFYGAVIMSLQRNTSLVRKTSLRSRENGMSKQHEHSVNRVKQVTKRIIAVILFYFFCWTPQWTLNLLLVSNLVTASLGTPVMTAIFFGAHLLVCFNSAANPVLYALINRELRAQHSLAMNRKRQSIGNATQNALDFVTKHTQKLSATHRPSLFSLQDLVEEKISPQINHSICTPPRTSSIGFNQISQHIDSLRHSFVGFKFAVFGHSKTNSSGNITMNGESTKTITRYASESVLSSLGRGGETEVKLETGDSFL
ncbi:unnamed protein product, partial [Mesorhabditis belari]|uniref:G-protein coupled receptors family 1 profile domain-containing protein n=1 Tax=Mesorhabditis belari TaxID=2138241 RepID=A0AAF3J9X5_9BILA